MSSPYGGNSFNRSVHGSGGTSGNYGSGNKVEHLGSYRVRDFNCDKLTYKLADAVSCYDEREPPRSIACRL